MNSYISWHFFEVDSGVGNIERVSCCYTATKLSAVETLVLEWNDRQWSLFITGTAEKHKRRSSTKTRSPTNTSDATAKKQSCHSHSHFQEIRDMINVSWLAVMPYNPMLTRVLQAFHEFLNEDVFLYVFVCVNEYFMCPPMNEKLDSFLSNSNLDEQWRFLGKYSHLCYTPLRTSTGCLELFFSSALIS